MAPTITSSPVSPYDTKVGNTLDLSWSYTGGEVTGGCPIGDTYQEWILPPSKETDVVTGFNTKKLKSHSLSITITGDIYYIHIFTGIVFKPFTVYVDSGYIYYFSYNGSSFEKSPFFEDINNAGQKKFTLEWTVINPIYDINDEISGGTLRMSIAETITGVTWTADQPSILTTTQTDAFQATVQQVGQSPVIVDELTRSFLVTEEGLINDCTGEIIEYGLSLKKDAVEIFSDTTTDTTYQYTKTAELNDSGSYELTVINDGNSVVSSPVVVNVEELNVFETNDITNGTTTVPFRIEYGYSTTIEMDMVKAIDARGIVNWLDNQKDGDNFTSKISVVVEDSSTFENLLSGDSVDTLNLQSNATNYPFTQLFLPQTMAVNVPDWSVSGDTNILGEQRKYTMSLVPGVEDIYSSYNLSGTIPDCCPDLNHWSIGGVSIPWAEWKQSINDFRRVNVYHGATSDIVDTKRDYGDIVEVSINVEEDQARKILHFFTNTMRGTEQTATFPSEYNPFGRRYEGITSCKVRLYDSILRVSHKNAKSVDIKFSLQMTGL